jgi:hypothetical protein
MPAAGASTGAGEEQRSPPTSESAGHPTFIFTVTDGTGHLGASGLPAS